MTDHPHDARAVANEILRCAERRGINLTVMQLIKLVYLANGWSLALLDRPLVKQAPQAWQYGPVYPHIYKALNHFGSNPVRDFIRHKQSGVEFAEDFSEEERDLLEAVVDGYGAMHAFQLSNIMHQSGTPWSITVNEKGNYKDIPEDLIKQHFKQLKNERDVA